MSDSVVSLPWSNNSDRKPMISRRDFTTQTGHFIRSCVRLQLAALQEHFPEPGI